MKTTLYKVYFRYILEKSRFFRVIYAPREKKKKFPLCVYRITLNSIYTLRYGVPKKFDSKFFEK